MTEDGRIRQLFSQTVIYGLGIMLNRSVSFILIPVYTGFFAPAELGVFTLVQSLSIFLGFIYAFGLETAFMKKFIDSRDIKRRSEIYSSTLLFLLISSVILSSVLYASAGGIAVLLGIQNSSNSIFLIRLMSIVMIADTIYRIPMLLFRAQLKARTYSLLNVAAFVLNVGFNFFFIAGLRLGVEAIFYSYLISVSAVFLLTLFMTRETLSASFSIRTVSELLGYGAKFILIGVFLLFIDMSDRFFLQHYFDESAVGIYWANYRLASAMGLVIAAFRFSWTPFFLNLNEEQASREVISEVTLYFVFAGSLLFMVFGMMTELIAPADISGFRFLDLLYVPGLSVIPALLLSYFFSGLYSTFNAAPFFTDNTKSLLYISFSGFVLNLVLNILLIPGYGMDGAAASTLMTYIVMFAMVFVYSQKIYRISLEYNKILIIFFGALAVFSAGYFYVNELDISLPVKIAVDAGLIAGYLAMMSITGVFPLSRVVKLIKPGK